MGPSERRRALFRVIDGITAFFGSREPLHWLSIVVQGSGGLGSSTVTLYEFDTRTYITDLFCRVPGWADDARSAGQGTLTTRGTDTRITLTEVTDPILKRQVLALRKGGTPPESFDLVRVSSVFEITPA
jgi:hypothetical protein